MVVQIITRLALGGAQQIVYQLASRLKEDGEEVIVFTGYSSDETRESSNNDIILNKILKKKIKVKICKYFRNSISVGNDLLAVIWIYKNLKKLNPSVVHIHSSKTGVLGRLACKLAGVDNVIYHVHGWSFSRSNGLTKWLYIFVERIFFYLTNKYIFVCNQDIVDYVKYGGTKRIYDRARIIYPGVLHKSTKDDSFERALLRKELGLKKDDFVIGAIGRLDFQKNPLFFFKFAVKYSKINSNVKFLWIGDGVLSHEVKKFIQQERLESKVILPGYIPEVEKYFCVFDIFTITSRYEGLPVTAIKSMAVGVPVVGFLRNGMIDLDKKFDSFFGVDCEDMEKFISTISRLQVVIKEKSLNMDIEKNFIKDHWSMESMLDEIYDYYKQEVL